jgi:hypothetical protein
VVVGPGVIIIILGRSVGFPVGGTLGMIVGTALGSIVIVG